MIKPDIFMPFFWPDFWTATKGWPDVAIVGYQHALSYYWFHLHCAGLPDDTEKLRLICERDKADWDECCCLIFDNDKFFKLDSRSGLWKQKRADEVWAYCDGVMKKNKARAVAGGLANKRAWQERRK